MEKEIWRNIAGSPDYQVSNYGRVISLKFSKIRFLKLLKNNGYRTVNIRVNGKVKRIKVHRLVAEAFIPNPKQKPYVNHKNGKKADNKWRNLEWSTHRENIRHHHLRVHNARTCVKCQKYRKHLSDIKRFKRRKL